MKLPILTALLIIMCSVATAGQPDYTQLADSCFYYLRQGDTLRFERAYPRLYGAYERQEDPELFAIRQELLSMRDEDQGIRLLVLEARKRYGASSPQAEGIHKRMKSIDAQNGRRIVQILDKYGWLGKEDIGEDANETLFLCIQHVDDVLVQEKYLPIIKQAVDEGNAEGWHYAFLVDRTRMNRGERQVYGTQTITGKEGKLDYVVPLEDPDRVDSLRRSVGLEPMEVYLDGKWDLEAYKQELPVIEQKYRAFMTSKAETATK